MIHRIGSADNSYRHRLQPIVLIIGQIMHMANVSVHRPWNHVLLTAAADAAAAAAAEVDQTPALLERQISELRRSLRDEKCRSIKLIGELGAERSRQLLVNF